MVVASVRGAERADVSSSPAIGASDLGCPVSTHRSTRSSTRWVNTVRRPPSPPRTRPDRPAGAARGSPGRRARRRVRSSIRPAWTAHRDRAPLRSVPGVAAFITGSADPFSGFELAEFLQHQTDGITGQVDAITSAGTRQRAAQTGADCGKAIGGISSVRYGGTPTSPTAPTSSDPHNNP